MTGIRLASRVICITVLALLITAGHFPGTAEGVDDDLTCRRAVGREGTRLLGKAAAISRKCEERRLRAPEMICPQASDEPRLTRARDRARSGITRACSDPIPAGLAGECPVPCAATVLDTSTLADCVVCFAEATVGIFMELAFPDPPEPGSVCGDGQVGSTEECDPPDDDACPGRCAAPGEPDGCECQPVESCSFVTQPPGTCTTDDGCPPEYTCVDGQCEAGICEVKADCPADGQCVHLVGAPDGLCICRGCGPHDCPLGCEAGSIGGLLIINGCKCNELDDCPPADDVCYQGVCS